MADDIRFKRTTIIIEGNRKLYNYEFDQRGLNSAIESELLDAKELKTDQEENAKPE